MFICVTLLQSLATENAVFGVCSAPLFSAAGCGKPFQPLIGYKKVSDVRGASPYPICISAKFSSLGLRYTVILLATGRKEIIQRVVSLRGTKCWHRNITVRPRSLRKH